MEAEQTDIAKRSAGPVVEAANIVVDSPATLDRAAEVVRVLKALQEEVNKVFEPIVAQAYKAHKAAKAEQNRHLEPLLRAEANIRWKMSAFIETQRKEREKAAQERARAEENLRRQPASQPQLFSAVPAVAPPKLPEVPAPPKVAGVAEVLDWKWKVVDAAVIPAEFWILDEAAISAVVRVQKDKAAIPGIEVYSEARAVVRK